MAAIEENVCLTLLKTGKELNSKMKYRQAMSCFMTSLNMVRGNCAPQKDSEELVFYFCESLRNAVETCLFLNNSEAAKDMLTDFHISTLIPIVGEKILNTDKVNWTLGHVYLALGNSYLEQHCVSSALECFTKAKDYFYELNSTESQESYGEILGQIGHCHLLSGDAVKAYDILLDAVELWRKLKYPLYSIKLCISTMKHYIEAQLHLPSAYVDDNNVCTDMLRLHKSFCSQGLMLEVPEAFTELGYVAYRHEKESTALTFLDEGLALYKQLPPSESTRDEIIKLLKDIGIASYNGRNFTKACFAYKECLEWLRQSTTSNSNMTAVAECYASLGFTYSRLRNFDKMLEYYEKALELHNFLLGDDLELIETNIGSLYHVKAVLAANQNNETVSKKYFEMAESAFTKSLRYSWKSFPYVNYGYYMLCRERYAQATQVLHQGFLNGRIDKDTVEFDHTEDPILLDDLKHELSSCEDIRMPSTIIALYLKSLCQARIGDTAAAQTAYELKQEAEVCRFEQYYTEGYGSDRMKALCFSLAGYVYRALGDRNSSRACFQRALSVMPDYPTAHGNIRSLAT